MSAPRPGGPGGATGMLSLEGIANRTDPGPELIGNAYAAGGAEPFPSTLREAVELWEGSEFAESLFGEAVWRHYLNYGRTDI